MVNHGQSWSIMVNHGQKTWSNDNGRNCEIGDQIQILKREREENKPSPFTISHTFQLVSNGWTPLTRQPWLGSIQHLRHDAAWLYSTPSNGHLLRHGMAWLYSTPSFDTARTARLGFIQTFFDMARGLALFDTFDMAWLGFIQHLFTWHDGLASFIQHL